MGKSAEEVAATCRAEFVHRNPMNDYTLPQVALTRSRKAEEMLIRTFGDATVETLEHEFFSVSCDLVTSELVVHRRGRVWEAAGASMALPGVFPPVAVGGKLLVDGGVLNNLPVDVMAATGEGPAIAVDVSNRFEPPACRGTDPARSRRARATSRAREIVVGSGAPLPSFGETLIRSIVLGSVDTTENAEQHADLVIKPDTRGIGLTQWDRIDHLRQAGREAARAAIAVAGDTFKIAR
jgi:NTE family protein